jgi:hypothetical protein
MTDRHSGYVATLARDILEDDAERIIEAIGMIREVVSVRPIIAGGEDFMARERVKYETRAKLHDAIDEVFK